MEELDERRLSQYRFRSQLDELERVFDIFFFQNCVRCELMGDLEYCPVISSSATDRPAV